MKKNFRKEKNGKKTRAETVFRLKIALL